MNIANFKLRGHRVGLLVLTALILAVLVGSALAAGKLVKNGSFERDNNGDGLPNKWAGGGLTAADKRVCNKSYGGSCSFKMVGDDTYKLLTQDIALSGLAGDEFTLSAWTKGKNIVDGGGYAAFNVGFSHTAGGGSFQWVDAMPEGSSPWTLRQLPVTAPENYDSMVVTLVVVIDSGKVWFDKVIVAPVP
jgi:hypothetical protein